MASRERVVEFAVKARDEYSKVLKNLEQQQKRLSAAAQVGARRDLTGLAKKEFDEASANYKRLTRDVDRYRIAQREGVRSGKLTSAEQRELGEAIKLTRDRAREAMTALNQKRAALQALGVATNSGYVAFNRFAVSLQTGTNQAQQQTAAVATTTTQLNKLTVASNTAAKAQGNLANKMNVAPARGSRGGSQAGVGGGQPKGNAQSVEIWGLKPWQLTNLGYQVNDVFSGLAMGQAPIQILAQQAGQFAQLWPNVMVSLARSIPIIAGVTAVLSPFVAAAMRLYTTSESVRIFSQNLALSADGARYNAEELAKAVDHMRDFGVAADDARALVLKFISDGISEKDFEPLARMAQRLSEITGEDVGDVGKKLSEAFSGNVEGVRELDLELNFLTASQYQQITAMAKAGDTARAVALAQEILAGKLRDTKQESDSWAGAVDNLAESWDNLVTAIQNTGALNWVAKFMRSIGQAANETAQGINDVTNALKGNKTSVFDYEGVIRQLEQINENIAKLREYGEQGMDVGASIGALEDQKKVLEAIVQARREEIEIIKDADDLDSEHLETRKKALIDIQSALEKQLEGLRQETEQAQLTNREAFIQEQLLKAKNEALERAKKLNQEILGLTQEQTDQIRKQAGETFDAQQYLSPSGGGIQSFVNKVSGVESGHNPNAKNPNSSATGLGQFISLTWLRMFKQYFPDRAASMSKESILLLRKDAAISKSMIELYARENAAVLKKAGVAITDASLYLSHFLGPQGAVAVLTANAGTPVSELVSGATVNANKSILQGKTAGEVASWAQRKMGGSDAEYDVQKQMGELDEKRLATEKEYGEQYQKRIAAQEFELENAKKAAREAAIAKALRDEELRAKEAGVTLTTEQIAKVKELAAAEFDRAHVNDEVDRLIARRTAALESLEIAQRNNDQGKVATVVTEIANIESQLDGAIEKAIAFWQAMGGPGAEQAILDLQNVRAGIGAATQQLQSQFLPQAVELNEQLADIGANAFDAFAKAIANSKNAAEAFFNALRQGIAEFLIDIAKAIIKQGIFNAISGGSGAAGGGGIGGMIMNGITSLMGFGANHTGGLIGASPMTRMVNPAVFAGAARMHGGGMIGALKPGEVPIIGMEDEEVVTRNDPRHVMNGGATGGGSSPTMLKIINTLDAGEIVSHGMQSRRGEQTFLNFIRTNSDVIRSALET